ncbi:response regulator [Catalinimonas sp. 4WD22]|uniref:response regulator n=1 Tax=Catalinimonas locisalis TaxID=3133978 RepID=UPI003101057F
MEINPVLIIDDDEISQMVLSFQVEDVLHTETIVIKENGEEALHFLDEVVSNKQEEPRLIFLDLNMPQISGYDFIKIYDKDYATLLPNVRLVILTSSVRKKDREMAKNYSSVKGFYKKPLEEHQLKEIMAYVENV